VSGTQAQTVSEVPLQATPQTLAISLAGTVYNLRLTWCPPVQVWVLDVADGGGNPLVQGQPLVTGADLLAQLAYLGIGGSLYAQSDSDPSAPPTFTNLGQQGHLYFVTPQVTS
jgi:hypothetical protein